MNVLVVDDHPLVRKGIVSTLSYEDNIDQINEASNIVDAIEQTLKYKPEIAVVDLYLGCDDGLEYVNQAKKINRHTKFIILTSSSKKEDFIRAQEADVDGYILKDAFTEDIIYAFHLVERGKRFYDSDILQKTLEQSEDHDLDILTPREKDVLMELGKGLSNIQIADKLFISEHTVKKHNTNILGKLGLSHRTEAALFANKTMSFLK